MNWNRKTIVDIHQALQQRKVTCQQLVAATLSVLAEYRHLNATTAIRNGAAHQCASRQDRFRSGADYVLWGIPFGAKDNFSVAHEITTASCAILQNYLPPTSASVIELLAANGANLVCKTTMDALGMGRYGLDAMSGPVLNPYDAKRVSGGSSSGSAVVVAIGAVAFALGTDTGDSVRKPASYCGLVGLKPTYGLVSRYAVIPFAPSLDTVGILCRSVRDCSLILSAIAGYDKRDFTSYRLSPVPNYQIISHPSQQQRWKVAYLANCSAILDHDLQAKYQSLFAFLRRQGLVVEQVTFPADLLTAIPIVYKIISASEASSTHANLDGVNFGVRAKNALTPTQVVMQSRSNGFNSELKKRFVFGSFCLKRENQTLILRRAQQIRALLVDFMTKLWLKYDILILPASLGVAPLVSNLQDKIHSRNDGSHDVVESLLTLANLVGFPSLTIPLTLRQGLPIGVNLNADCFQEQKLFQFGQLIEQHTQLVNLQVPPSHA